MTESSKVISSVNQNENVFENAYGSVIKMKSLNISNTSLIGKSRTLGKIRMTNVDLHGRV